MTGSLGFAGYDDTLPCLGGLRGKFAKLKERYETYEPMRVVFRDGGFKDAEVKTNDMQILKQAGIEDVKSV